MQVNIMKSAMKSGLILGILFSLKFLLSLSANTFMGLLSWAVLGAIVVAVHRLSTQFRDKECGGYISYSRAFLFILLSFFYASLISSLVKFIYFQFINPDYLADFFNQIMLMLEGADPAMIDIMEENLNFLLRPASFSLVYIWVNMLGGMFLGLIMAAFVKKEKSIFEEE